MRARGFIDERRGQLLALLGVVLGALSIRNAVAVFGPLFTTVSDDLGLDVVVLSLVGAAPPIGFALAGLVAPAITLRWGLERTLIVSLGLMVVGQALRALSVEAILLVGSTTVVMVAIGAVNVLLPPLVRRYFPNRVGGITSMYLVLLGVGTAVPAFTAVQLAEGFGWRGAFGVWLVIPLLALVPWLANLRIRGVAGPVDVPDVDPAPSAELRRVVTAPTAWAIAAAFALSSISAYAAFAYLPAMLSVEGLSAAAAGIALGLVMAVGIPEALIVPILATRTRNVLAMLVVAGLCGAAGWLGMLWAPASAPYLWAVLIGLAPIAFPLALLLVNTRTRDHQVTVSVSAFVQGVGYVAAGAFALGVGLLHDATGNWQVPIVVLLATMALAIPAVLILRHDRTVDDEIRRTRAPQPR